MSFCACRTGASQNGDSAVIDEISYEEYSQPAPRCEVGCEKAVNRRWTGTPDRRPKGTPLIGEW
jgi:hypothetical protein